MTVSTYLRSSLFLKPALYFEAVSVKETGVERCLQLLHQTVQRASEVWGRMLILWNPSKGVEEACATDNPQTPGETAKGQNSILGS